MTPYKNYRNFEAIYDYSKLALAILTPQHLFKAFSRNSVRRNRENSLIKILKKINLVSKLVSML